MLITIRLASAHVFKVKRIGHLFCVPLSILSTLNLPHPLGYPHWILLPLAVASAVIYLLSTVPLAQVSESQYKLSLVQNGYDSKHSPFLNRHWDYWVSSWFNFCNLWHCFYEQTHRSSSHNTRNLGIVRKYSSACCNLTLISGRLHERSQRELAYHPWLLPGWLFSDPGQLCSTRVGNVFQKRWRTTTRAKPKDVKSKL